MYSIDEGLASIKESLALDAPEPHDGIMEMGLSSIRECLYGAPEPGKIDRIQLEEACEAFAEYMISSEDPFVQEAMTSIDSILESKRESTADRKLELKNTLLEACEVYSEGLINFKIDSIEKLKEAINIVDVTPRTSGWLVGIVVVACYLYAAFILGLSFSALNAIGTGVTSLAAALGLTVLVVAAAAGAFVFGFDALEWVITKVYNKITGSKELRPTEVGKAVKKILNAIDDLEQKFKRAGKVKDVQRVQRLYDDIARRWGIYQEELAAAAAAGGVVGGMIGAQLGR